MGRTARCIDLHGLTGYEFLSDLQLDVSPDGGTLSVMPPRGTSALFLIDTRTDEVTEPAAPDTSAGPQEPDGAAAAPSDEPSGFLWPLTGGAGVVLLILLIGGQRLLRRRSRRPSSEPLDLPVVAEEEIEVELGDPLLDEAPESERPPVLVP